MNEICVDDELGTVVPWNVGEDLLELTEYFPLEGVLHPARTRHYIKGKLRMEINQKFSVIDGPVDWTALSLPNPTVLTACKPYRRPRPSVRATAARCGTRTLVRCARTRGDR